MQKKPLNTLYGIIAFFWSCIPIYSQVPDSNMFEDSISRISDCKSKVDFLLSHAIEAQHDSTIAFKYAMEALNLSRKADYDSGIFRSMHRIVRIYSSHKDYSKAQNTYNEIIDLYSYKLPAETLGNLYFEFAEILFQSGNLKAAWENYNYALDSYTETKNKYKIGTMLERIGLVYLASSNPEKAEEFFFDAIEVFTKLVKHYEIGIQNAHLGDLYQILGDYQKAEDAYKQTLIRAGIIKNDTLLANINYRLGKLNHQWRKYKKAHENLSESIHIYQQNNAILGVAKGYAENASVFINEKNYSQAIIYFNKAISAYSSLNKKNMVAGICLEKGRYQFKNGYYNDAHANFIRALELAYEIESDDIKVAAYFEIQLYYKQLNNYEKSLEYLKKYVALKDTLFNRVKEENIARITEKYETEKKERENEALRAEQELKEQIIQKTEFENKTLVAGILIFLTITLYLIYLNNQRKKSNHILSLQNKDIRDKQNQIIEINIDLEKSQQKLSVINSELKDLNKSLEFKVEERTAELRQSNDEMDTFLYQSSHALRRPIAQVKGLIQLARMEKDALDIKTVFEKIDDTTKKMELMLQKLVLVSEIDFYMPKQEFVDPEKTIMEAWKQMSKTHGNTQLNPHIIIKPDLEFYTDTKLFNIIISNLLENSFLYSTLNNELAPYVKVEVRDDEKSFIISVHDNGMGIPESAIKQILNMFYFATEKTKGYGLGLYLASKSIRKIYGNIDIISHEKGNTVFEISYPKDYYLREYESIPEEYS